MTNISIYLHTNTRSHTYISIHNPSTKPPLSTNPLEKRREERKREISKGWQNDDVSFILLFSLLGIFGGGVPLDCARCTYPPFFISFFSFILLLRRILIPYSTTFFSFLLSFFLSSSPYFSTSSTCSFIIPLFNSVQSCIYFFFPFYSKIPFFVLLFLAQPLSRPRLVDRDIHKNKYSSPG